MKGRSMSRIRYWKRGKPDCGISVNRQGYYRFWGWTGVTGGETFHIGPISPGRFAVFYESIPKDFRDSLCYKTTEITTILYGNDIVRATGHHFIASRQIECGVYRLTPLVDSEGFRLGWDCAIDRSITGTHLVSRDGSNDPIPRRTDRIDDAIQAWNHWDDPVPDPSPRPYIRFLHDSTRRSKCHT